MPGSLSKWTKPYFLFDIQQNHNILQMLLVPYCNNGPYTATTTYTGTYMDQRSRKIANAAIQSMHNVINKNEN